MGWNLFKKKKKTTTTNNTTNPGPNDAPNSNGGRPQSSAGTRSTYNYSDDPDAQFRSTFSGGFGKQGSGNFGNQQQNFQTQQNFYPNSTNGFAQFKQPQNSYHNHPGYSEQQAMEEAIRRSMLDATKPVQNNPKEDPKEAEGSEDWAYEGVVQFLSSNQWKKPMKEFVDAKCEEFDDDEENKFSYTEIHNEFQTLAESLLEKMLTDLGIDQEKLQEVIEQGLTDKKNKKLFEQLLNLEDFMLFKKMMVKRNKTINYEKLMKVNDYEYAKMENLQYERMKADLERAKLEKEKADLDHAIELSLALERERMKLLQEEDEQLREAIRLSLLEYQRELDKNKLDRERMEKERLAKQLELERLERERLQRERDELLMKQKMNEKKKTATSEMSIGTDDMESRKKATTTTTSEMAIGTDDDFNGGGALTRNKKGEIGGNSANNKGLHKNPSMINDFLFFDDDQQQKGKEENKTNMNKGDNNRKNDEGGDYKQMSFKKKSNARDFGDENEGQMYPNNKLGGGSPMIIQNDDIDDFPAGKGLNNEKINSLGVNNASWDDPKNRVNTNYKPFNVNDLQYDDPDAKMAASNKPGSNEKVQNQFKQPNPGKANEFEDFHISQVKGSEMHLSKGKDMDFNAWRKKNSTDDFYNDDENEEDTNTNKDHRKFDQNQNPNSANQKYPNNTDNFPNYGTPSQVGYNSNQDPRPKSQNFDIDPRDNQRNYGSTGSQNNIDNEPMDFQKFRQRFNDDDQFNKTHDGFNRGNRYGPGQQNEYDNNFNNNLMGGAGSNQYQPDPRQQRHTQQNFYQGGGRSPNSDPYYRVQYGGVSPNQGGFQPSPPSKKGSGTADLLDAELAYQKEKMKQQESPEERERRLKAERDEMIRREQEQRELEAVIKKEREKLTFFAHVGKDTLAEEEQKGKKDNSGNKKKSDMDKKFAELNAF